MMQVLQAGGIPVLRDDRRPADPSNPRGYFEYEKVKWLAADNAWLGEARGRAIKIIAQLIPYLPRGLSYQVLFMERDLDEVLQSQQSMIAAMGKSAPSASIDLGPIFHRQFQAAQTFVRSLPNTVVETFSHREMLSSPESTVARIAQFLKRPDLNRAAMARIVDASLYRSRKPSAVS
jgi:hypothetical protein